MSKPNPTRNLTRGAQHETFGPNFKRLKAFNRRFMAIRIRNRIAAENVATRGLAESWADLEQRKAERLAMLRAAHQRSFERSA